MKVRVGFTQYEDAILSDQQVLDVATHAIRRAFEFGQGEFINRTGELVWDDWGRHGSPTERKVRDATDDDRAAMRVIAKLREVLK